MPYSVLADLEKQYGSQNISKWADLNGNKSGGEIAARVAWAIEQADAYIDDHLRYGPYAIPFDDPPPTRIKFMSARMAGVMLYESRGVTDFDADGNAQDQLMWQRKTVDKDIREIMSRRIRFDLEETSASYPQVITGEDS